VDEKMKLFFELLQIALGHRTSLSTTPSTNEWEVIYEESERHTITGFLLHAIDNLPKEQRPPQSLLLQWIGVGLKEYEYRYELYREAIAEMASWYNSHGYKMMVLKGYACSLDWPNPEYRPCGDIDIWLFGKQKEADALMSRELGLKIDASHHHHTVFSWRVFVVENHYDFINVYAHKSNAELEKIFKELGKDDSHFVEVMITSTGSATKIYLPSPNLHALFLVKHMASHFASSEITIRQVLDWAFFVEQHTDEVDWNWLLGMLDQYHMRAFFNLINAICVENLGFPADIFPEVRFLPELKDRVLADILEPAYGTAEPTSFLPRIIYKYRRWQGNAWKQELCYSESRWSMFWNGLWAKILKPSSI
jgi:hypothetical protein